jgi:hypothetical protein
MSARLPDCQCEIGRACGCYWYEALLGEPHMSQFISPSVDIIACLHAVLSV